jgi:hypothetical protein
MAKMPKPSPALPSFCGERAKKLVAMQNSTQLQAQKFILLLLPIQLSDFLNLDFPV